MQQEPNLSGQLASIGRVLERMEARKKAQAWKEAFYLAKEKARAAKQAKQQAAKTKICLLFILFCWGYIALKFIFQHC